MQPPFNTQFGDIYFSAQDGLAETRHTFLAGNGLPERWVARKRFTIAETGFGTGLNFLAAWTLFEETAPAGAVLDYVAVELYPLTAEEVRAALLPWAGEFGGRLERLLGQWPMRVPGFHRLHFGRVRLTLIYDDVKEALPQVEAPAGVDAWFLDGFAPAKNPDMWGEGLYREMARLSAPDATAATFTAAGAVRRGLAAAGFTVEKKPGFGRKRDMTAARLTGAARPEKTPPKNVAVIGGGLAGTSAAFALKRRGIAPVVYEKEADIAAGASGNPMGLCNPRFSALRTPQADFFAAGYAVARRVFDAAGASYAACGSLHLINSPEREKRFDSMRQNWRWDAAHMRHLDAAEASGIAGVPMPVAALWLPDSLRVSPASLCRSYCSNIEIRAQQSMTPGGHGQEATVIACAMENLPVHTVRGQVTMVAATEASAALKANICYGGYISAPFEGQHMVGSTFQKWMTDMAARAEDDADNLAKLAANVPALAGEYRVLESRAAMRLVTRDHFPLAGLWREGVYVSTGHGSHGILSSLVCAELLADMMEGSIHSLPKATVAALSPGRFGTV